MKYGELIQFSAIEASVSLPDTAENAAARRVVEQFRISRDMAARLTGQVFPFLRTDRPPGERLLLITGPRGVGKSHLLAAVAALAEDAGRSDLLAEYGAIGGAALAHVDGLTRVGEIAGRFEVLRLRVPDRDRPLRTIVLDAIEAFLAGRGVPFRFPASSRRARQRPAFDEMLSAFAAACPGRGLLLALDELSEFLAARRQRETPADLDFLRELGHACRNPHFRVIAVASTVAVGPGDDRALADALHRFRRHCDEIPLGGRDATFVLATRVVPKTPGQRAQIEAHLARFTPVLENLRERMPEFVEAFPIHPDFAALFEKDVFAERRGALRLLSDTVDRLLDTELPADAPGIAACDSYWPVMRANPHCRSVPEISAVLDFAALLEERIAAADASGEDRAIARRMLHVLAIERLTSGDLYNHHGPTVPEMRDGLCLTMAGAASCTVLLENLERVADLLCRVVNGPRITVRVHGGRYHLHFRKFRRFHTTELILHWVNAVPFLLLLGTGAFMLVSRFSHVDRELLTRTVRLHQICALTWLIGMPLTVLSRFKPHWANIRTLLTWGPTDMVWMVQSMRSLYRKDAVIPPAGRLNTGQKINACLVVIYFFGFAATGALMYFKGSALIPWYVHTSLFFASLGSVGGHMYLALINPSTRIALGGIFHGWAPMKYVEHHHALTIPKAAREHARAPGMLAIARDIMFSRLEMGILILTVLLGAFGAYAFGAGRMAAVKSQFSKSFADVIQPNRLSTKHDIGPTAESCTKCHLYTGEIPDRKCEECHQDIRERRDEFVGYHGSLKGDCRFCHREHRDPTRTLVPLNRDTFDHDEATFELTGRHEKVKCDDCHAKLRTKDTPGVYYIGLPHDRCTDCHKDRHAAQFEVACETCHSPNGWTGRDLNFAHDTDSKFHLEGKHAAVDCRKCHKPPEKDDPLGAAKFKGLDQTCLGCHEDPHRKQFEARCTECHSPDGWDRQHLDFDHNKDAKFALKAKHATVACDKCHKPEKAGDPLGRSQFVGLKSACADCHQDPHGAQFKKDCTVCHPAPEAWKVGAPQFVHNRDTKFALVGKHSDVQCTKCHQPRPEGAKLASAKFTGLGTSCEQCHTVKHPEAYGTTCTACHAPDAWSKRKGTFDHGRDAGFDLMGRHLVAKCSACHNTPLMGVVDRSQHTAFTCLTCHQKDDPHRGVLGLDCAKCHTSIGWKGDDLIFDHDKMARFKLDRDHERVACAKCHENGHWKPLDTACSACHSQFFLDQKKR